MIEYLLIFGGIVLLSGFKQIRSTERGLVETFGKYTSFKSPGLTWVMPGIQRLIKVNITEKMTDVEPQEIITKDNLNAIVDLVISYKVKNNEEDIKNSVYSVNNIDPQLETIARTSTRNVIGTLPFKEVNSERNKLNKAVQQILQEETKSWGVDILKVEMKDIRPPQEVQDTMNQIIKAENQKIAALDFATAKETEADGIKRAKIKEAEGQRQSNILQAEGEKQSKILKAEGEAAAFELINKSFIGNSVILKKLEVTENTMKNNTKVIIPHGQNLYNVIGNLAEVA